MEKNCLQHYGVLGMKWGVRKDRSGSRFARRKRAPNSEDYERAKTLKKKSVKQLSNAELRELNNRMQLESQYRNLKKQNVSAGKKFVQDVAYEAAKGTASEYTKKYAKKGLSYVGSKIISR